MLGACSGMVNGTREWACSLIYLLAANEETGALFPIILFSAIMGAFMLVAMWIMAISCGHRYTTLYSITICSAEAELLDIYLRCSSLGFPFELSSPPWQLRGGCAAARAEKLFNASCRCILSTALPGPTPGPLLHLDIIIVFLPMPNVT